MQGNRKARRKLAKLASKGDRYIEQLALASTNREIERSANEMTNNNLSVATEYALSAMVLALDKTVGWKQCGEEYDSVLSGFREFYAEIILSDDPEHYIHMAEDICGQEMQFEFLDSEWDFRVAGTPIEMYVNGVWRRGTVCENDQDDDSIVTMVTKTGQKFWNDIGSHAFRKPVTT